MGVVVGMAEGKSAVMQVARKTLRLTTMPFHLWLEMCSAVLRIVLAFLTAPPVKCLEVASRAWRYVVGDGERKQLRAKLDMMDEYARALKQEAEVLQQRVAAYESQMKKAERLRETTFEEMRGVKEEVATVVDYLREQATPRFSRKSRSFRDKRMAPSSRQTKDTVPVWFLHVSTAVSLACLWYFVQVSFGQSVQRKLLLCLLLPLVWMYSKTIKRPSAGMSLVTCSIAWFLIGFVCCNVLHLRMNPAIGKSPGITG